MPMRMVSLAPRTRPDDLVPAIVTLAAAASVDCKNLRRVKRDMAAPFSFAAMRIPLGSLALVPELPPDCKHQEFQAVDRTVGQVANLPGFRQRGRLATCPTTPHKIAKIAGLLFASPRADRYDEK